MGFMGDHVLGVAWIVLIPTVGPVPRASTPVVFWIVSLVAFIGVWWLAMWFLLGGRISWRRLDPCAVAIGACWVGMLAVFDVTFSGMITSYDQKYGAIGIVLAFMSLFIAIGVVLILGAAVGLMWQHPGLSWAAALRKLRRSS